MKKYNPVVTDLNQIAKLNEKFEQAEALINQRIYNSQIDEKNRIIRLKTTHIFSGKLADISKIIARISLTDMHPELNLEEVKPGSYFLSSGKTDKFPVRIVNLDPETISILWFSSEGTKFQRTLVMKQISSNRVKVNYYDFVKGFKTIYGLHETHFKKLYVSKQALAFRLQMTKVLVELTEDEKKRNKLTNKVEKFLERIANKY